MYIGVFFSFSSANLYGQFLNPTLFDNSTRLETGFAPTQSQKLDNMIANPIYLNHFFVSVNELSEVLNDRTIPVQLPDENETIDFVVETLQYTSADDFILYGTDLCSETRESYLHLIAQSGRLFGQINRGKYVYELQDLGQRKNVLFKIDPSIYTEKECATEQSSFSGNETNKNYQKSNEVESTSRFTDCEIRVLVLYTANAEAVGQPHNSAPLFMEQTKECINNSEVDVNFKLVGVEKLNGFIESQTIELTRNNLQMNSVAQSRRGFYEADLVVLLTDGNWGGNLGVAFLDEWGNSDFGYVVCEIDGAGGVFTFTHEIAHLFGCKHKDDMRGAPDFVFSARGHDFRSGNWPFRRGRLTIMRELDFSDQVRIMHFSNPNVDFQDIATGTTDFRDNAKQLSAEACNIADYENFTPPLSVNITGPLVAANYETHNWCASIEHCSGTVTSVNWEYSTNGINYWPINSTNTCISRTMPFLDDLYLKVKVVCSNGAVAVDWHIVRNENLTPLICDEQQFNFEEHETSHYFSTYKDRFIVHPNPVDDVVTLTFNLDEDAHVQIQVITLTGKTIKYSLNKDYLAGIHYEQIDLSNLPSGSYFIKANLGHQLLTQSIIKL